MKLSELWNKVNSEVAMMKRMENMGGGWEWGSWICKVRSSHARL
jgi:hypothetical protein